MLRMTASAGPRLPLLAFLSLFQALPKAIALPVRRDDHRLVRQPIQERRRQLRVSEHLRPPVEVEVGRYDEAPAFITQREELK